MVTLVVRALTQRPSVLLESPGSGQPEPMVGTWAMTCYCTDTHWRTNADCQLINLQPVYPACRSSCTQLGTNNRHRVAATFSEETTEIASANHVAIYQNIVSRDNKQTTFTWDNCTRGSGCANLRSKVVDSDMLTCSHKEKGSCPVESHGNNATAVLTERILGCSLG